MKSSIETAHLISSEWTGKAIASEKVDCATCHPCGECGDIER